MPPVTFDTKGPTYDIIAAEIQHLSPRYGVLSLNHLPGIAGFAGAASAPSTHVTFEMTP